LTLESIVISGEPTTADAPPPSAASVESTSQVTTQQQAIKTDRPEWLPAKFKDAEQMAQSYLALEKMLGAGETPADTSSTTTQTPDPNTVDQTASTAIPDEAAATKQLADKGFDYNALTQEYAANGKISDETYAALAAKDVPKSLVDSYIEGRLAVAEQQTNTLYEAGGGKEAYTEMAKWASTALPADEQAAFNRIVQGTDHLAAKFAIAGLAARYNDTVGRDPSLLGGRPTSPDSGAFRSRAEITAAIRDPRYDRDPAYRGDVEQKIMRSKF